MTTLFVHTVEVDQAFPHLMAPLDVLGGRLRNRVVMGSMHTGLEDSLDDLDALIAYDVERARGGVGLIVTGGYSPTIEGRLTPDGAQFSTRGDATAHRRLTDAVHEHGAAISLQLLHAGRYGTTAFAVAPSATRSPISATAASGMSAADVEATATAFATSARLAQRAGYDGVEVMGSEGYLINQFLAARTNQRDDAWGGSAEKRMRFPVEVVRRIRDEVGEDFIVGYRISLLDLVEDGQDWAETMELASRIEAAGASLFVTGIGWHESRVPTIVSSVPRAAWVDLAARLRAGVGIPVAASNRINTPDEGERLLSEGAADLVAMARPFLADPEFVAKAAAGRADEINTCIACNQACLDRIFGGRKASCLVNPRAGRETVLVLTPAPSPKRVAVVGGGPAGLAAATSAAERGHVVTLFEADGALGGQFRLAQRIPGKSDFAETLRYFSRRLEVLGVDVRLGQGATAADLRSFDAVIVATGVRPRIPDLPGIDHPSVVTYADLLSGRATAGGRVAVIGAGGIGVDVSEYLLEPAHSDVATWRADWGVGDPAVNRGGLTDKRVSTSGREVWLLQRKDEPIGKGLGRTTGWVHRQRLRDLGVHQIQGATYERIDDDGLHLVVAGEARVLAVETVVLCAGQESVRDLAHDLPNAIVIGGADRAGELDAERAIRQGTEVAATL